MASTVEPLEPDVSSTTKSTRSSAAPEREPRTRFETEKRRAQLVELGLEKFGTRSYDEVSMEEIAQAAGISKGLIYHYFPTKRAFYVACVRSEAQRFLAFVNPHTEGTPADQLRERLDAYLTFVRGRGRAFTTLMRSGIGVDTEIAQIVDEARNGCLHILMHGFDALPAAILGAEATPDFLSDPLVRIALRGFIGFAEAVSIEWVEAIGQDPRSLERASQEDVRELLVNALVATVTTAFAMKNRG